MADALSQNVSLANALANFSKVLFGSAPVKITETEEGSTTVKGTALSAEAINAMLREMTEGGLSGQGSGGIAGLAAIMHGQKSAGLYNSPTTMQLMNKNAANIAEKAALASAQTTTTITPKRATRTTSDSGLIGTPAGQVGLMLAGASLLKNKKFKKMIGFDDLSSIQDAASAPQSIEAFNQSVAADAAGGDYIGTAIQETVADSGIVESAGSSIASNFGFEVGSDVVEAGTELLGNFDSGILDQGIEAGTDFVSSAAEAVTDSFDFSDFFSWDWFADGGLVGRDGKKIPGYADGGLYNTRTPTRTARPVVSSAPITGPLAVIPRIPSTRRKGILSEEEILNELAALGITSGPEGGVGSGVAATPAVDSTSIGAFTSIAAAVMGAIGNAVNNAATDSAIATEGEDVGSSIGSSTSAGGSVGSVGAVGDDAAGVAAGTSPVGGGIGGGMGDGSVGGDAGAADGDAGDAGWKSGGEIKGKGTGTSDSNVIRVSDGEYIIPADVVEIIGVDFFDELREKFHTPVSQKRRMQ